ncbi:3-deoxy-D-manno-octulosonic acid transferase [Methylobacterium isbiliense]|uniref:3-deoxy-D-manno-octulosonic acid transferase n=1 Tax=Methylobacterium isbiliense TaxID=315478 RepID=A0ABQ4SEK3_9HYPH|nr:3-deoxy-D-manno-octulosonic acid transferase [Methylobacterium isbiliense]MDN3622524.1 3-deoxy-D-manno-octulosonic acid transferase [Methylobacterium isbiliense]GJE01492.1 3-deoxy-D-manno-octulosonic acid transferase [Methylobacterium isbiliense]
MTRRAVPPLLRAYHYGLIALEPALAGLLAWRRRKGKEDPLRLPERVGRPGRPRPAGPLVWAHGASIGEALSLIGLVERLTQRGFTVLVTSGTRTSAELLAARLPTGALHQFAPLDAPRYVERFLDHWRPDLALVAESELWPNTILALDRRGVPLILVNGRMSERSANGWARTPDLARAVLSRIAVCLVQTREEADRFLRLGAPRVMVSGNLKFDAAPPPADPQALGQLAGLVQGRPVWLAASTHPGEEEMVTAAHRALAARCPALLTVVVPRHPRRGPALAAAAQGAGLRAALRSQGGLPDSRTDLYVADTVGELGLFYRLSPLAVMGGSFVEHGGQNPIEAARLDCAILHGPHVWNFAQAYEVLGAAGGARPLAGAADLAAAVGGLLGEPERLRAMAEAGRGAVAACEGALERTLAALEPFICQMKIAGRFGA